MTHIMLRVVRRQQGQHLLPPTKAFISSRIITLTLPHGIWLNNDFSCIINSLIQTQSMRPVGLAMLHAFGSS